MSLLSKLFGGGKSAAAPPQGEAYEGFLIYPEPIREGKTFRLCARITCEIDGELKEHRLIRADTLESEDACIAASRAKAKQMVDEQGKRLFS
jgi:hypothetical protein